MELWERFSGHARRAVLLAHDETQRAKMQRIGTEHLLLGLLRLGEGMAIDILRSLEVDLDALRGELREQVQLAPSQEPTSEIAFTPEAQKVLQHAYNEAKNMGQAYIGTEHLLVGLVREERGAAHRIMARQGIELEKVREALRERLEVPAKAGTMRAAKRRLDRLTRRLAGTEKQRIQREEFARVVVDLAREVDLHAVVLVIGRDGLETCLTWEPGPLKDLLEHVKRLLEGEQEKEKEKGPTEED